MWNNKYKYTLFTSDHYIFGIYRTNVQEVKTKSDAGDVVLKNKSDRTNKLFMFRC